MKRGSIYRINLEPSSPPEFGKIRPGVIVSNTDQNLILSSVVVIPLSSREPEIWPLRIELRLAKGKKSFAVLPGMRQVSKTRLLEPIGTASAAELEALTSAIFSYLSD